VQSHIIGQDKNKNRKKNLETVRETHIIGKKARKLNNKKAKLEKLQEITENGWEISQIGTSQEVGLQALNLVGIVEPRRRGLFPGESI
jgi:hypothetical protein